MMELLYCTCCQRQTDTVVWLELNTRTGTYHTRGIIPKEDSQGWFGFGRGCAKRLLTSAKTNTPGASRDSGAGELR
jgi:hypothetical protein